MDFKISIDNIIEQGKEMKKIAEYANVALENLKWEIGLPLYEQFMLRDAKNTFMINTSGLNEKDFYKYQEISKIYRQIEKFYEEEGKGIHKDDGPFDLSLTKEQAYEKYCHCDRETAEKIAELIFKLEKNVTFYVKDIREKYKGDLGAQLGMEKGKYIAEEKAHNLKMDLLKNRMEEVMKKPEIQEKIADMSEAMKQHEEFVSKIGEEDGKTL